jgi:hypothetical protein
MIKKYILYVLFMLIGLAAYPIIRYYYFLFFNRYTQESSFFVTMRVFVSVPLLLFSGFILVRYYRQWIIGLFSIILGLWFMVGILQDLPAI